MTTLARRKALVVDDDVSFTDALTRWLAQLGCEATVATSAQTALEHLTQDDFDVLLLDLSLPDGTGHMILRQLSLAGASISTIMISGTTDPDDVVRALRANVVDFLRKPFKIDDLATALENSFKHHPERGVMPGVTASPAAAVAPSATAVAPFATAVAPSAAAVATPPAAQPGVEQAPFSLAGAVRPAVAKMMQELREGTLRLPAPDPMLARLPEMLSKGTWSATEVADLIARDHNFSVRVLGTANSVAFSRGVEIHGLAEACRRLGSKTVLALGLEILVQDYFTSPREPYKTLLNDSWQNAMACARIARLIGQILGHEDPGELYLVGLLHNIGEQLAITLFAELDVVSGGVSMDELAGEIDQLHELLGGVFTSGWKLPSAVVLYAGHHHRPTCEPEPIQQRRIREIVLASWATALQAGFTYLPGHSDVNGEQSLNALGISGRKAELVLEQARKWKAEATGL